jgi:fatty-acyl-CoA synthase
MLSGDGRRLTDGRIGHIWRYSLVRELALRIANALRAEGFGLNRRAVVLATNDVVAYIATLGIMRAGVHWIPLNPRYSAQDNADILDRSTPAISAS